MRSKTEGTLAAPVILRLQYALTAAAGALDVFCVTRLGGAFASVITGNLVQVGSAIVRPDVRLAARCAIAVAAFAAGVACGAVMLRRVQPGWTRLTTLIMGIEFLLIAAVAVLWQGTPTRRAIDVMLGLASLAMGLQSAATVTSGLPGAATTYFTGTLTTAMRTMVTESQGLARGSRSALRLVALLAGAVAGGVVLKLAPAWSPALPALIIGTVAMFSIRRGR